MIHASRSGYTYLCLEQSHDVLKFHVRVDLNDKGLTEVINERELHSLQKLRVRKKSAGG